LVECFKGKPEKVGPEETFNDSPDSAGSGIFRTPARKGVVFIGFQNRSKKMIDSQRRRI
jgi:hypothetical protein